MAIFVTLFLGFAPMFFFAAILYWLDRYEKEPLTLLVGVFAWGMVIAAGAAYIINTVFGITVYSLTGSATATDIATGSLSAPLVEESLKGFAVLLIFFFFRTEFDSIVDGIIYAGVAALGFAATENVLYIWRGYNAGGWDRLFQVSLIRIVLIGWQHPVYTSFTGIGLALARINRSTWVRILAPLAGFGMAIFTHSLHNTMAEIPFFGEMTCFVSTFLDWFGVLFILTIIIWASWNEKRNLTMYLQEEVTLGTITPAQYRTACSALTQNFARLASLFNGKFISTNRFYQVCGELSHKKEQIRKVGEEQGNSILIQRYRAELARLSISARA